ncbi:non-canonical purine NTP pyrophosphatase, RdgB/HAM1 family [Candidatus Marinamargulisbacteria bacterium SCGC AAA071-K20]|nr:non-canonical purine NTP pyrophosphatase, RdgB/HAM1 family [Candidatus Marinamargulisbacteria bacterium SCGC AAA071-K20]
MRLTLALCTNNPNKVKELSALLPQFNVCLYQAITGKRIDVVEDGTTFEENAIKKVSSMPIKESVVFMSDDSGLEVDAFNGEPGIHSARLGGDNVTSTEQCQIILKRLGNSKHRGAQFTCVIALRFPDGSIKTSRGIVRGEITSTLIGEGGFGYDPIFRPEGYEKTFSELKPEIKNSISHRYQAINLALKILES